nr:MAG TPA: hypothetical protein [Caudoviricetes sp.]
MDKWCSANVASSVTRMVEPFFGIFLLSKEWLWLCFFSTSL